MMKRVAVGMLLSMVGTAAHSENFDLVCKGDKNLAIQGTPPRHDPYTERFRIDLNNRRWCRAKCELVIPIVKSEPNSLVLSEYKTKEISGTLVVDPISLSMREYTRVTTDKTTAIEIKIATCISKAFTPFQDVGP